MTDLEAESVEVLDASNRALGATEAVEGSNQQATYAEAGEVSGRVSSEAAPSETAMTLDSRHTPVRAPWTHFMNQRVAAAALVAVSLVYLGSALFSGHSASSTPPADLSANEAGLSVWQASAVLLDQSEGALVVDTRSAGDFSLYHLPRAVNAPGITPEALRARAEGSRVVLVVSDSDAKAAELIGQARQGERANQWHYLTNGVRDWYLTFTLPVPLFSEKPPPFGYAQSLKELRLALETREQLAAGKAALSKLRSLEYAPSLLAGKTVNKAGGSRKKITGGCGG